MRAANLVGLFLSITLLSQARPAPAQVPAAPLQGSPAVAAPVAELFPSPPADHEEPPQCRGIFLSAEFLDLWPNRDGLGLAVVSNTKDGSGFSTLESLSWDATPAFRLGARYLVPDTAVEFGAEFTYLRASTNSIVSAPEGGSLLGSLATDSDAKHAAAAEGKATLSYGVLDLDVGKSARLSDSLGVRAFGGVRLAEIDQTLKGFYNGGALGGSFDYVTSPVRFQGAGLTAGAEAVWEMYRGWGLYGRGRFGLLSASFNSQRTEVAGSSLISDETEQYYTVISVAELGAGVSYQTKRCFLSLGYEVTDWFNMVSGIGGPGTHGDLTDRKRGDITLEGLKFRLGFSF